MPAQTRSDEHRVGLPIWLIRSGDQPASPVCEIMYRKMVGVMRTNTTLGN